MAVKKPVITDGFGRKLEYDEVTEKYSYVASGNETILEDNLLKRQENGKFWALRASKGFPFDKEELTEGLKSGSLVFESDHQKFYAELSDGQKGELKTALSTATEPFNINKIVRGENFNVKSLLSKTPESNDETGGKKTDSKDKKDGTGDAKPPETPAK